MLSMMTVFTLSVMLPNEKEERRVEFNKRYEKYRSEEKKLTKKTRKVTK